MTSAIIEAILGFCLLVLFIAKFLKIGPLLKVNEVWASLGSKANFINKWWFNLIFIGISLMLISAPVMQFKASKLNISRDDYAALQTDANKYGISVEDYFEEIEKSKELKFKDVQTYLNAKKFEINDPIEFSFVERLGRLNLSEWQKDKDSIARSGKTMEQYVRDIEDRIKQEQASAKLLKKSDESPSDNTGSGSADRCMEIDKGKALIEIYTYSCDAEQLAELEKKGIVDTIYCRTQGNIKKRKIPC